MSELSITEYWLWLTTIPGIGRKTLQLLLKDYQTPVQIYNLPQKEYSKILKSSQIESLLYSRNPDRIHHEIEKLRNRKITFVYPGHPEYPVNLTGIDDAPVSLYIKGDIVSLKQKSIAIVGAREASSYGREMARLFARELARAGVNVISGLARGIDSCAHQGALAGGGKTYGILGCGVNVCYPPEHIELFSAMVKNGGVISEYPPETMPKKGLFPQRNRIISGLSDGILIIEARGRSGALITVDQGLEQGKEIYVLPGRATDAISEGCNNLIKMGARLVTKPSEILQDSGVLCDNSCDFLMNNNKVLDGKEKLVYSGLSLEPKYIDLIIKETNLPVQEVLSILFGLELKQYIKQIVKNYYIISI